LGCFDARVAVPDTSPVRVVLTASVAVAPVRLGVLACDRPDAPKQSVKPGTTGESVTTGPMHATAPSGASLEVWFPWAHAARVALQPGGGQLPDTLLPRSMRCSSNWRTIRGGSFNDVSSHEMTRLPSSSTFRAGAIGGSDSSRSQKARPCSSATASIASSDRVMHHRDLWRDVPLRRSDYRGLAGRS
jgi:hypothetical protein